MCDSRPSLDTDPSVIKPRQKGRKTRISDKAITCVIHETGYTIAPTPLMENLRERRVKFTRDRVRYRLGELVKRGAHTRPTMASTWLSRRACLIRTN